MSSSPGRAPPASRAGGGGGGRRPREKKGKSPTDGWGWEPKPNSATRHRRAEMAAVVLHRFRPQTHRLIDPRTHCPLICISCVLFVVLFIPHTHTHTRPSHTHSLSLFLLLLAVVYLFFLLFLCCRNVFHIAGALCSGGGGGCSCWLLVAQG